MRRAVLFLVLASCGRPGSRSASEDAPKIAPAPRQDRILLTGALDAVSSHSIVMPKTPQANSAALRWLEADGAHVKAGQKVVELDNTAFSTNLADQKLNAVQTANDLAGQDATDAITTADRQLDVERARIALGKAKIEASVAEDTVPRRTYQEKQLAKQRAESALAKAKDELASQVKSAALEHEVRRIALEKAERDIATAEKAIESFALRAPFDGVLIVSDHPWEGRKLKAGDNAWVGMQIAKLPDLAKMKIVAALSDVDDGRVTVGMHADAILDAYPDVHYSAIVSEVNPVAREPSERSLRRTIGVTLLLDRTEPEKMIPGMSVRVEITR